MIRDWTNASWSFFFIGGFSVWISETDRNIRRQARGRYQSNADDISGIA
jgi:hypothetical protein